MELKGYEKEHLKLVQNTAGECCVLLKSDGHFPLSTPCKLAAFGNGVRHTIKGGTGSGDVNSRFSINIEKGLLESGFEITTYEWLKEYDEMRIRAKKQFINTVKAEARALHQNATLYGMGKAMPEPEHDIALTGEGDTAIYVITRDSGEGNDRQVKPGDVLLAQSEIRDILLCNKQYRNFMLVLNVGGVVDLTPVLEVKNILLLSQLGVVTGKVLADILLGKQYPSGKLATTWSAYEDYSSLGNFGDPDDTDYKEGIYVGYRYFNSLGKKPLFPFGYGISYTKFEMDTPKVCSESSNLTVSVNVKNIGNHAGKEVVQVYVSAPWGHLDKPFQDLVAFGKTPELAPGSTAKLSLSFSLTDIASYDEISEAYLLEKGDYKIRVGFSSEATQVAAIARLAETVTVLKAKNVLGKPGFTDYRPEKQVQTLSNAPTSEHVSMEDVPVLNIAFDPKNAAAQYDKAYPIEPEVASLSDEELIFMNIGAHDPNKKGLAAVIGNAAPHIAGGAGETSSYCEHKGIPYLTMSDGPAGLRLARDYFTDDKGAHAIGSSMLPESMMDYLNGPIKFLLKLLGLTGSKAPKNVEVKHQYATAIPIGTAIAQSFNTELATKYGDMVGSEMEMFGINFWLAPALNIHRSILCGRNFEYFSEDPLISGRFAAAITMGVQEHKGCGTTIKHYAANNQEICRYTSSSNVSERAMREIYLRGFGICVREAQPHSIMTSYNLLNGVHTSEHKGLIEDILRAEYGYQGVVMTDWTIAAMSGGKTKYRVALSSETAKAGNDLFMPGAKSDYDNMYKALTEGTLSRKQLEINVSRTVRMIRKLKK